MKKVIKYVALTAIGIGSLLAVAKFAPSQEERYQKAVETFRKYPEAYEIIDLDKDQKADEVTYKGCTYPMFTAEQKVMGLQMKSNFREEVSKILKSRLEKSME